MSSTKFDLPYLLILLSLTFLLYSTQFEQIENFLTDGMQVNLHVRSSKYRLLWNVLVMDGQIKSNRLKVYFLRDRYTVQSCQT